ncbi:hypothetical protein LBMAG53_09090 [Planctomycetota bacterium]|nr:hypothetical protein LBMAG53_09090 [Planctomycetota bacterium]
MALSVNFNVNTIRSHAHLTAVDRLLSQSIQRLSSGLRIEHASDDPVGLVMANGLRQQLAGLNRSVENAESGVSMIQTAEGSLDQISSLLSRARQLAIGAANGATVDPEQLVQYQRELSETIASVTRIAEKTAFGGVKLLTGGLNGLSLDATAKTHWAAADWDASRLPGGISEGTEVSLGAPQQNRGRIAVTFAGAPAAGTSIAGLTQNGTTFTGVPGGTILTAKGPLGQAQIPLSAATTIQNVVDAVNTAGIGLHASYISGTLTVEGFTPGPFAMDVDTSMSGAANVALLDGDTATDAVNPLTSTVSDPAIDAIETVFAGAPAGTSPIQGLVLADGGATLDAVAGGSVTVRGPLASRTFALLATTTIDDFVTRVNADAAVLGTFASYDATTGSLRITSTAPEHGQLSILASDMTTGGSTIGLLDSDTTTADNANALPSSNLRRERIAATLTSGGSPPTASATLTSVLQAGGAMTIAGGETVVVRGTRGSQTIILAPTTTIQQFLDQVNSRSENTGARAAYDPATGELSVESLGFGAGALAIESSDLGGGAGLLDSDVSDPWRNAFAPPRDRFAMSFTNVLAAGTVNATRSDSLWGLTGDGVVFDAMQTAGQGRQLTLIGTNASGQAAQVTMPLTPPLTPQGLAAEVANRSRNTFWDSAAGTLTVFNASSYPVTTVATLNVTDATTPQQFTDFLRTPAVSALTGLNAAFTAGNLALTPQPAGAAIGPAAAPTAATLATFFAANTQHTTFADGKLTVWDDTLPTPLPITGQLPITATTTIADIVAWANTPTNQERTLATLSAGAGTATITPIQATADTIAVGGTTLGDVIDFINERTDDLGMHADFIAASGGNPARIEVVGTRGSINVQSESLSSTSASGLLDRDTATVGTGSGLADSRVSSAPNRTMTLTFTDAGGTPRSVHLTQVPAADGGLTFTNLEAGPEAGPPFTGWKAGAFRMSMKDSTDGGPGTMVTVPTATAVAMRTSTVRIQTGIEEPNQVAVEVVDVRANALGWSSMRQRQASSDPQDQAFIKHGLFTLQDLVDTNALQSGRAQESILVIDAAIAEVSATRGRAGAIQSDSVETALSSLRIQIESMTSTESMIRDADFALESANYAKHNLRYEAAMAMLGQANQVPRTILQLLQQ